METKVREVFNIQDHQTIITCKAELERLRKYEAEVERLRGVMQTISDRGHDPMFECAEIARRALEGGE